MRHSFIGRVCQWCIVEPSNDFRSAFPVGAQHGTFKHFLPAFCFGFFYGFNPISSCRLILIDKVGRWNRAVVSRGCISCLNDFVTYPACLSSSWSSFSFRWRGRSNCSLSWRNDLSFTITVLRTRPLYLFVQASCMATLRCIKTITW